MGIRPGTGPYRVVQQVVEQLLVFERNRYFHEWSPAAQPSGYPDKIVVRVDGTASADVAAVAAGRADWTFDTPTQSQLVALELRTPGLLHRYQALGTEWADSTLASLRSTTSGSAKRSTTQSTGTPS